MKQVFLRFIAANMILPGIIACSPTQPDSAGASGTVRVLVPWAQSTNSPEWQVKELRGLESLETLNGEAVRFYLYPSYSSDKSTLTGKALQGRFVKSGSHFVALDDLSMQLSAVYAHFQELRALDARLGVEKVNTWPRKVAVLTQSYSERDNAFYEGKKDHYVLVPYTRNSLPLAVNGGVLAHEHFHSLFFNLVTKELLNMGSSGLSRLALQQSGHKPLEPAILDQTVVSKEDLEAHEREIYFAIALRGLNEGLADFWGYLYSQDTDFLGRSLVEHGGRRSLKTQKEGYVSITSTEMFKMIVQSHRFAGSKSLPAVNAEAYALATQYARIFKVLSEKISEDQKLSAQEGRLYLASAVLQTLPTFAARFKEAYANGQLLPITEIFQLLQKSEVLRQAERSQLFLKNVVTVDAPQSSEIK